MVRKVPGSCRPSKFLLPGSLPQWGAISRTFWAGRTERAWLLASLNGGLHTPHRASAVAANQEERCDMDGRAPCFVHPGRPPHQTLGLPRQAAIGGVVRDWRYGARQYGVRSTVCGLLLMEGHLHLPCPQHHSTHCFRRGGELLLKTRRLKTAETSEVRSGSSRPALAPSDMDRACSLHSRAAAL